MKKFPFPLSKPTLQTASSLRNRTMTFVVARSLMEKLFNRIDVSSSSSRLSLRRKLLDVKAFFQRKGLKVKSSRLSRDVRVSESSASPYQSTIYRLTKSA